LAWRGQPAKLVGSRTRYRDARSIANTAKYRPYNLNVFTGLIRYTGSLLERGNNSLAIEVPTELGTGLHAGDSIAVNGVCLTAVRLAEGRFEADMLPATLVDTTLGSLPVGSVLNLEPALRAGEPLGGHLVQGHVDGTTKLLERDSNADSWRFLFALPAWLSGWIVPKGSICVNGVSLTVQHLDPGSFCVELIPETLQRTNLRLLLPGQRVNLEADLIVKTVSELLKQQR
jgi:riboflavin synthase